MQLERLLLGITFESVAVFHFCTTIAGDMLCSRIKKIAYDAAVIDLVLVQRGYCVLRYQGCAFRMTLRFIGLVLV